MDRNEKKNSFRNVQNSRGNDREAKKYKRAFHITLAVAVVLAASTGGLGFTTYRLSRDEVKNQESEEGVVVIGDNGDGDKAKATPETGKATTAPDDTQSPESAEEPEGTVTPEASVTTAPEENAAEIIKVTVTNSLDRDINTIDIREATGSEDDSEETWNKELWKMEQPLTARASGEYSVKLDGLKGDNFDIRITGNDEDGNGIKYFRNLPLKSIKEIELKLDNGQEGSGFPYAEYKDKSGKTVSTLEEVKKREEEKNRKNSDDEANNTETSDNTSD